MTNLDAYCRPYVAFADHDATRRFDAMISTDILAPVRFHV